MNFAQANRASERRAESCLSQLRHASIGGPAGKSLIEESAREHDAADIRDAGESIGPGNASGLELDEPALMRCDKSQSTSHVRYIRLLIDRISIFASIA